MMKTPVEKYLKRFEAYKNGVMNSDEQNAFHRELEQNMEMKSAWNEYEDMMAAFSDKEALSLREKLEASFNEHEMGRVRYISRNFVVRAAIAATIILSMGALLYFFCSRDISEENFAGLDKEIQIYNDSLEEKEQVGVEKDNNIVSRIRPGTDKTNNEPLQVASIYNQEIYQISPIYAELLNNVYRSSYFKLLAPHDSTEVSTGDIVSFSWKTNITESLYFDILDRNGEVVYTHPDPIGSPWSYEPDLEPAIYMFRFATKNEPVWMGVFVIK